MSDPEGFTPLSEDDVRALGFVIGDPYTPSAVRAHLHTPPDLASEGLAPLCEASDELRGLLERCEHFMRRFVMFSNRHQSVALALWVLHVYAFEAASTTPYLRISSAAPESGKSRTLEVLLLLLGDERAVKAASLTSATVFRAREDRPLAFLLDEVDALAKRKDDAARELIGIVNDAYRRGATALRTVPQAKGYVTKRFPVFGPTALAGLARLADSTESRCIPIVLDRKPAGSMEDFLLPLVEPDAVSLRERLDAWATEDVIEQLRPTRPNLDELRHLRDRVREVWWPLVVLADAAGGDWPVRAREAALALHGSRAESETSDQILLLEHIAAAFDEDEADRLPSAALLRRLVANEEGPWGRYWGAEVERESHPRAAATDLARKLRPFGVRPRVIRLPDGTTPRGYLREQLEPVWATYLPPTRNTRNARNVPASGVAPVAPVAGRWGEGRLALGDPESNGACSECGGSFGHMTGCSSREASP